MGSSVLAAVPSGSNGTPAVLPLSDLAGFEAQQDALVAARLQAVAWEMLRLWEAFPEVDRIVLASFAHAPSPNDPDHGPATGPMAFDWSMSARDGRDRLEEYVLHQTVGDSRWDQGHAQTGQSSPYGAWATNRLRRWGPDEHTSVRNWLIDLGDLPDGLHRDNPVEPLVGLLTQHLPGGAQARTELANAWGAQAQAWCVAQEQAQLRQTLDQASSAAGATTPARPRERL